MCGYRVVKAAIDYSPAKGDIRAVFVSSRNEREIPL